MQALFVEAFCFIVLFGNSPGGAMHRLWCCLHRSSSLRVRYAMDQHQLGALFRGVFAAEQSRNEVELLFCHRHGVDDSAATVRRLIEA